MRQKCELPVGIIIIFFIFILQGIVSLKTEFLLFLVYNVLVYR